jgi:hypothetical protein
MGEAGLPSSLILIEWSQLQKVKTLVLKCVITKGKKRNCEESSFINFETTVFCL